MSTRSRAGCWTCKTAKRKCDGQRPTCKNCLKRGSECEGYNVRLRWGSGIASRGRFAGAEKPVDGSAPPRPKGRRRDLSRERKRLQQLGTELETTHQSQSPCDSMTDLLRTPEDWATWLSVVEVQPDGSPSPSLREQHKEQLLFQEFLTTGINVLHAATIQEVPLALAIPQLCQESAALYKICLALQCYLKPDLQADFLDFYNDGLVKFRSELSIASTTGLRESNLISGLLLCTIELMRGTPWTLHLEGMYRIRQSQEHRLIEEHDSSLRTHLVEVMGVMDIPVFVIGRRTPHLAVWRQYRQCMPDNTNSIKSNVEVVSGLPRSLLDLLAGIGQDTTEMELWNWPGEKGSTVQCQLWESHRLAGMLSVRRLQKRSEDITPDMVSYQRQLPSNDILVLRILSSIEAIVTAYDGTAEKSDFLVINAINYPVLTAGLEIEVLRNNPEYKDLIRRFFTSSQEGDFINKLLQRLLDDLWEINNVDLDINDLARSEGIETGLY